MSTRDTCVHVISAIRYSSAANWGRARRNMWPIGTSISPYETRETRDYNYRMFLWRRGAHFLLSHRSLGSEIARIARAIIGPDCSVVSTSIGSINFPTYSYSPVSLFLTYASRPVLKYFQFTRNKTAVQSLGESDEIKAFLNENFSVRYIILRI